MQDGCYQTTGGMVTQFNRLEVITNNLTNINTSGYKRDGVTIVGFERIFKEAKDELPIENHTKDTTRFVSSTTDRVPQISQDYTDFSTDSLEVINNPLDFAMTREDAFYFVQTKNGELRLIRNENLQLDDEGCLVSKQGYKVLNSSYFNNPEGANIVMGNDAVHVNADKSGNISVDGEDNARLFIAQVDGVRALEKDGGNTYKVDDLTRIRDLEISNLVKQGFSQDSNVNPVSEMVGLIETNRMVEMHQKAVTTHTDDLNQDAINKLASVK